jgi:hypothetical protein
MIMVKGKAVPEQAYCRPGGFQEVEAHRFQDSLHMKVVKLSARRKYSWYSFLFEADSKPRP